MQILNVSELKKLILEKVSEEELKERYTALASKNKIFKKNKQMAYHIIATEVKADISISFSSSGKQSFPLKIGELFDSEKDNFNLSGYILSEFRTILTKNGKVMMFVTISDNTGITQIAVFEDNINDFLDGPASTGDFVTLSNLYWKDKGEFMPIYGKYSSVTLEDAPFELSDTVTETTKQVCDGNYFTIKAIATVIPPENKYDVFHCEEGHRLSNMSDADLGTKTLCDKCSEPKDVLKHLSISNFVIADEEGQLEAELSIFANVSELNVMDEFIFKGKYTENMFKIMSAIPTTKKKE